MPGASRDRQVPNITKKKKPAKVTKVAGVIDESFVALVNFFFFVNYETVGSQDQLDGPATVSATPLIPKAPCRCSE